MRRRIFVGTGIAVGAALVALVQRTPTARAMPPECTDIGGGRAGCCGNGHDSPVHNSDLPDGWGCQCNDGYVGMASGNSSVCVADPGGWAPPLPPPPTDPGGPGGGGVVPGGGDLDCREASVIAPTATMDPAGKVVAWTDVERATWTATYEASKRTPPVKACKDKKKEACAKCTTEANRAGQATQQKYQDCLTALNNEAVGMCHRGILADGRLAAGHQAAEDCFQSHGQRWFTDCNSAVPEEQWECAPWYEGGECGYTTTAWDQCSQTYYKGRGAVTDHIEASGSASWTPVETIHISLGGSASETITWGAEEGGLKKCQKMRDARDRVKDSDGRICAANANTAFVGGNKCYPP